MLLLKNAGAGAGGLGRRRHLKCRKRCRDPVVSPVKCWALSPSLRRKRHRPGAVGAEERQCRRSNLHCCSDVAQRVVAPYSLSNALVTSADALPVVSAPKSSLAHNSNNQIPAGRNIPGFGEVLFFRASPPILALHTGRQVPGSAVDSAVETDVVAKGPVCFHRNSPL